MGVSRLRQHITSNTPCHTTDTASTAHNRTSTTSLAKHLFIFPFASANGVLFFFGKTLGKWQGKMPFEKELQPQREIGTHRTERFERGATEEESLAWEDNTLFVGVFPSNYYYWFFLIFCFEYWRMRGFFFSVDIPIHTQQLEFNFFFSDQCLRFVSFVLRLLLKGLEVVWTCASKSRRCVRGCAQRGVLMASKKGLIYMDNDYGHA